MMKDKNMTAGKRHNLGLTIVNAGVVMEAHTWKMIKETEEKVRKEEEVMLAGLNALDLAVFFWRQWEGKGKLKDNHGKLKLSQQGAKTIVKVLMPRKDPEKKTSEYTAKYKCVDWLMSLEDWEADMEQMNKDSATKRMETHVPLFSLGP